MYKIAKTVDACELRVSNSILPRGPLYKIIGGGAVRELDIKPEHTNMSRSYDQVLVLGDCVHISNLVSSTRITNRRGMNSTYLQEQLVVCMDLGASICPVNFESPQLRSVISREFRSTLEQRLDRLPTLCWRGSAMSLFASNSDLM